MRRRLVASMSTIGGTRRRAGESSSDLEHTRQQRQNVGEHSGAHHSSQACSLPTHSLVSYEHPTGMVLVWSRQQHHMHRAEAAAATGAHTSTVVQRVCSMALTQRGVVHSPYESLLQAAHVWCAAHGPQRSLSQRDCTRSTVYVHRDTVARRLRHRVRVSATRIRFRKGIDK